MVVLIGTGVDRGGSLRKLGHFAARRWRLAGGGQRSEILVAGEGLDRSPDTVLATLLHEAAHALAFARGIRDTSQRDRYHCAASPRSPPSSACKQPRYAPMASQRRPCSRPPRHAAVLGELADALVLWRAVDPSGTTGRRAEPTVLCLCACPRQIRLRWSILHGAPVLCGECGASFLPRSLGVDPCPLHSRSNDCNHDAARRRGALTRTYLGASRAAELLGCTQGWLWRLRSQDPDFPAHSVEIHEPKATFLGWTQQSIHAYDARRRARGGRPGNAKSARPQSAVFIGVNRIAELLQVTRSRVLQLRDSDPQFPRAAVKLLERTRIREGYDERAARDYARQRTPTPGRPAKTTTRVG